ADAFSIAEELVRLKGDCAVVHGQTRVGRSSPYRGGCASKCQVYRPRISLGEMPYCCLNTRLKCAASTNPQRRAIAATVRVANAGSARSARACSTRRFLITVEIVVSSSAKSECRCRTEM